MTSSKRMGTQSDKQRTRTGLAFSAALARPLGLAVERHVLTFAESADLSALMSTTWQTRLLVEHFLTWTKHFVLHTATEDRGFPDVQLIAVVKSALTQCRQLKSIDIRFQLPWKLVQKIISVNALTLRSIALTCLPTPTDNMLPVAQCVHLEEFHLRGGHAWMTFGQLLLDMVKYCKDLKRLFIGPHFSDSAVITMLQSDLKLQALDIATPSSEVLSHISKQPSLRNLTIRMPRDRSYWNDEFPLASTLSATLSVLVNLEHLVFQADECENLGQMSTVSLPNLTELMWKANFPPALRAPALRTFAWQPSSAAALAAVPAINSATAVIDDSNYAVFDNLVDKVSTEILLCSIACLVCAAVCVPVRNVLHQTGGPGATSLSRLLRYHQVADGPLHRQG